MTTRLKDTHLDGDVGDIAALTTAALSPSVLVAGGNPFVTIPDGYACHDLERMLPSPVRKRGIVAFANARSLIEYVNLHKTTGTAIFADVDKLTIAAVINHHAPSGEPGWGDWRAACTLKASPQLERWKKADGQRMDQDEFVAFIENNRRDVAEPSGAELLDICRRVTAKKTVEFVSATRLSDGSREFQYTETVRGATAKGSFTVPETFRVAIPFFQSDAKAYAIAAFLRYRISEGGLTFWFDLQQLVDATNAAFDNVTADVAAETGVHVFAGKVLG